MRYRVTALAALLAMLLAVSARAQDAAAPASAKAPFEYLRGTAYHILPQTTTDESGYFSLNEGIDGKVYIGTAAYGRNAYLVEFDPATKKQRIVIDVHKVAGLPLEPTGYAAQAKIHTRNFTGPSGTIYVGTKEGYQTEEEKKAGTPRYSGGYVMTYDPKTDKVTNHGKPMAIDSPRAKELGYTDGEGVGDVMADEKRGLIYIVTCEHEHWFAYDMNKKEFRELDPNVRMFKYAQTLIDNRGRAWTITKDYSLARYDPESDKVTVVPLTMDGKPFFSKPNDGAWIPTWQVSPDGKTAYLIRMNHPELLKIDLSGDATESLAVTNLGPILSGPNFDSRCSVAVAPDGRVYVMAQVSNNTGFGAGKLHHVARYDPKAAGDNKIEDLGVLAVKNPDFYGSPLGNGMAKDPQTGKDRPWTHGYHILPDGTLTPLHAHMGLIATKDGSLYATILYPYTLLHIAPEELK